LGRRSGRARGDPRVHEGRGGATLPVMSDEQWFYCLKHHTVEGPDGCRAADRLGPYPDKETASRALEIARERTEAADRSDAEWNERGAAPRGGSGA
jgi:hypothetical protein